MNGIQLWWKEWEFHGVMRGSLSGFSGMDPWPEYNKRGRYGGKDSYVLNSYLLCLCIYVIPFQVLSPVSSS